MTQNEQQDQDQKLGLGAGVKNIKSNVNKAVDAAKVLKTLGPEQVKDEISIAKIELKDKGMEVGKGAAVAVVAIVFALFMAIALVILAYVGLSSLMPAWGAALTLIVLFLALAGICGLVAYKMIKKQLPFTPESAVFGLLYDLGVLKEGSAMSAKRLKAEQAEKAAAKAEEAAAAAEKAAQEPQEPAPAPLTKEELLQRTKERREQMKLLRDDLENYSNSVQAGAQSLADNAVTSVKNLPAVAADSGKQLIENASRPEVVQARWKSFATLGASLTAFLVLLRKLTRR